MVDMAHDRDDRGARLQILGLVLNLHDDLFDIGIRHADGAMAEFVGHQLGGIGVDGLVAGDHQAHAHQRFDDIGRALGHPVGQFRHKDRFGQLHIAGLLFGALVAAHGLLPGFFLLALHRGQRTLTPAFAVHGLAQRQLAGATVVVTALVAVVIAVIGRAGIALTLGLARRGGGDALGLGACGSSLGRGAIGRCGGAGVRSLGLGDLGFFLGAEFGFAGAALILFGLQPQGFLAFAVLALFGLDLKAATLTLFLAGLFLGFALRFFLGLAGFGGAQGGHAALHLGIRDACGTARRIARNSRGRTTAARRRAGLRSRHDNALALGFNDHIMGPAVAEALLHLARTTSATANTQGFLSVRIAHSAFHSFPADAPPSCPRRPVSLLASLISLSVRPPGASALCMT